MPILSKLKRRTKQFFRVRVIKRDFIGQGHQGIVHRVEIQKQGNSKSFAVKKFHSNLLTRKFHQSHGAFGNYYRLKALQALGFPTVPVFFPRDKKRLLMADLTLGGKNNVNSYADLLYPFNHNGTIQEKLKGSTDEERKEAFFQFAGATNGKELTHQLLALERKAERLGVGLGNYECIMIVVNQKNNQGKLVIADAGEISIPKKIIPENIVPQQYLARIKREFI
ncbi:MAG: hypothetical protein IPJ89_00890 [Candidatus Iainarchaeum archaeon]|uniref:Uncharacterized protein n=1 Tax=Candidatus Iainarchaeum sp. TaxID=3101447 RepID=A0A7T9DK36_9ARCH|nr:MAG: hypothetical protein IPJ89_00890 [Candidatus Diapherotrites archaeon]